MFHVRIDSPPWGPNPDLASFDAALCSCGSKQLDISMLQFPLENDNDHFTRDGQLAFSDSVANAFAKDFSQKNPDNSPLLVIADSTVDFHNWSDGEWTGWASSQLVRAFGNRHIVVDAVCGSGFIARARTGEHFHNRLSTHLRNGFRGSVLLIGGWNDERTGRISDTISSIHRCGALMKRYA